MYLPSDSSSRTFINSLILDVNLRHQMTPSKFHMTNYSRQQENQKATPHSNVTIGKSLAEHWTKLTLPALLVLGQQAQHDQWLRPSSPTCGHSGNNPRNKPPQQKKQRRFNAEVDLTNIYHKLIRNRLIPTCSKSWATGTPNTRHHNAIMHISHYLPTNPHKQKHPFNSLVFQDNLGKPAP